MITRRTFLIGVGTTLTLPLVDRFADHIASFGEPILVPPKEHSGVLYVYPDRDLQIGLNGDPWVLPPISWREFLTDRLDMEIPSDPEEFEQIEYDWGVTPSQLDEDVDPEIWIEHWSRSESPNARAFDLLSSLDLGPELTGDGMTAGGLQFIDGACPGNDYLGVQADDMISVSLLQHRLNELDTGLVVQLGE